MMEVNNNPGGVNLKAKYITATRDLAAVSGDVAYTGVGFQPKAIIALCNVNNSQQASIGVVGEDILSPGLSMCKEVEAAPIWWREAFFIAFVPVGGNSQKAILKSYDADGFTLTWVKTLAPTGTAQLLFLCLTTG